MPKLAPPPRMNLIFSPGPLPDACKESLVISALISSRCQAIRPRKSIAGQAAQTFQCNFCEIGEASACDQATSASTISSMLELQTGHERCDCDGRGTTLLLPSKTMRSSALPESGRDELLLHSWSVRTVTAHAPSHAVFAARKGSTWIKLFWNKTTSSCRNACIPTSFRSNPRSSCEASCVQLLTCAHCVVDRTGILGEARVDDQRGVRCLARSVPSRPLHAAIGHWCSGRRVRNHRGSAILVANHGHSREDFVQPASFDSPSHG